MTATSHDSQSGSDHKESVQDVLPLEETTVGQRIRILRGTMTQRDFSRVVEIHKSSLGRYERGEGYPDAADLRKICERLNVNPDWLLFGGDRQIYVAARGRRRGTGCKTCDLVMKTLTEETRARQGQEQTIRQLVDAVNELKAMVCALAGQNNYIA